MQVITTEGVPPGERFEFWRDIVAQGAMRFRMEPMEPVDHAPQAEMRLAAIGGLALVTFEKAFTIHYSRTRAEIARSQAPYYFLGLQPGPPPFRSRCRSSAWSGSRRAWD